MRTIRWDEVGCMTRKPLADFRHGADEAVDKTIEVRWDPSARVRPRTSAGRTTVSVATLALLIVGILVVQPTNFLQAGLGGLVCAMVVVLLGQVVRFLEPRPAPDEQTLPVADFPGPRALNG
jgi:hypothetical protein